MPLIKYHKRIDALWFALLFIVFGFFSQQNFPLNMVAFIAVFGIIIIISKNTHGFKVVTTVFQLSLKRSSLIWVLPASLLGISLSIYYRWHLKLPLFYERYTSFLVVAALIGATEELLFRGFLQGLLDHRPLFAMLYSSSSHATYKISIFLTSSNLPEIRLGYLFMWTFVVGLAFGYLTLRSKSVWPAVLAHAIFDILVYGGANNAPWWLW